MSSPPSRSESVSDRSSACSNSASIAAENPVGAGISGVSFSIADRLRRASCSLASFCASRSSNEGARDFAASLVGATPLVVATMSWAERLETTSSKGSPSFRGAANASVCCPFELASFWSLVLPVGLPLGFSTPFLRWTSTFFLSGAAELDGPDFEFCAEAAE